jgi:hypothetical protein
VLAFSFSVEFLDIKLIYSSSGPGRDAHTFVVLSKRFRSPIILIGALKGISNKDTTPIEKRGFHWIDDIG